MLHPSLYTILYHAWLVSFFAMIIELFYSREKARVTHLLAMISFQNLLVVTAGILVLKYDGVNTLLAGRVMHICTFAIPFLQQCQMLTMSYFVVELLKRRQVKANHSLLLYSKAASLIGIMGAIASYFTGYFYYVDASNHYHHGRFYLVAVTLMGMALSLHAYQVLSHRMHFQFFELIGFFSIFLLPLIAVYISYFYSHGFISMIVCNTIAIIILHMCQILYNSTVHREQERQLLMASSQIRSTQLRPQFMFKTMDAILPLIEKDPQLANNTIQYFSNYLRKTLGPPRTDGLVSFQSEIDHLKNYLYLVKLSCEKPVHMSFDINLEMDFLIPYMSIEPLVESSVRHRIESNHLVVNSSLRAWQTAEESIVEFSEEGIGFHELGLDLSEQVSMQNLIRRLDTLCNGTLTIHTIPKALATITIRIPRSKHG